MKNPRIFYSFVAVSAVVTASVLSAGIYTGFFDGLNSEASAQEKITTPMSERVNTEMPSLDEAMN